MALAVAGGTPAVPKYVVGASNNSPNVAKCHSEDPKGAPCHSERPKDAKNLAVFISRYLTTRFFGALRLRMTKRYLRMTGLAPDRAENSAPLLSGSPLCQATARKRGRR